MPAYTIVTNDRTLTQGVVSGNALNALANRVSAMVHIVSSDHGALIRATDIGTPGPGWQVPVNVTFDLLGMLNQGLPAAERYVGGVRMLYISGLPSTLKLYTVEGVWTP